MPSANRVEPTLRQLSIMLRPDTSREESIDVCIVTRISRQRTTKLCTSTESIVKNTNWHECLDPVLIQTEEHQEMFRLNRMEFMKLTVHKALYTEQVVHINNNHKSVLHRIVIPVCCTWKYCYPFVVNLAAVHRR